MSGADILDMPERSRVMLVFSLGMFECVSSENYRRNRSI